MQEQNASQSSVRRNELSLTGAIDPALRMTELTLPDGRTVRLETAALLGDSTLREAPSESIVADGAVQVIPIIEERLHVGTRVVETGRVRLIKSVQEYQETLDEPLAIRTFDIERVLLHQVVDTVPEIRIEGETTIYPVVEEQMVLTKVLMLKEEVRVTRRDTERRDNQAVTLRREHIEIERVDVNDKPKGR